jgi:polysaccharide export outer membrane protein
MKQGFLYLLLLFLLFSCVSQRNTLYVQSQGAKSDSIYTNAKNKNIKIEPFDVLHISISSMDQPGYNFFNNEKPNVTSITEQSLAVIGYTVNDSGYVLLPILGKIKVQGSTLEEAGQTIALTCKSILNNPVVAVRFVNNTVTILGEVLHPGTYIYPKEQLSVFRAIGLSGDILEYGNRKQVILIREKNKSIQKHYLDLTSDAIFTSEYYFLRPNDVLYVQPLKIRRFGMKEFPFALIVSAVTSVFLILYYVKK